MASHDDYKNLAVDLAIGLLAVVTVLVACVVIFEISGYNLEGWLK